MPFDFDAAVVAPFRMQPGLRRVAPGQPQLSPNRPGSAHLGAKLAVLTACPGEALRVAPGFDHRPALRTLMDEAFRSYPDAFDWDGGDGFTAHLLDVGVRGAEVCGGAASGALRDCLNAVPASMRAAALLGLAFEEDVAGIDAATSRIPWLAVCLPSHWSPVAKVGRHFAEVHAPVPDAAVLVTAGEHLLRLVASGERWERFVWSLTPRAALDAHPARVADSHWPDDADAEALGAAAFFRTEHQTFIPVPETSQAVFTIRVAVQPLRVVIDTPARADRLHAALASMSGPVLAYRGMAGARDRLLAWLARRAA